MNFRVEFFIGCEAAVLEGASDKVARGRLVSLEGFLFLFCAKNEKWRDLQLVSQITFGSGKNYRFHLPTKTIERVCVSKSSKEQITHTSDYGQRF